MGVNEREVVLDMLLEVEKGTYSHIVSRNTLDKYGYLEKQVRSFIKRTFEGTLEYRDRIDWEIDYYSKTPLGKMKPVIRNILRLSVYQIMFMDVPNHAICNEAVKLAGKRGFAGLKGFVNGVLRSIIRDRDNLPIPVRSEDELLYLSVRYSMPRFIVKLWVDTYGTETAEKMLYDSLLEKPFTVRLNENKCSRESFLAKCLEKGIIAEQCGYYKNAFALKDFDYIEDIPGYEEGYIYIQDVSSMLACLASGAGEGSKVIDVCAAPGGKSMFLSELVGREGSVISRDLTDKKTDLIKENADRLGVTNVIVQTSDARVLTEEYKDSMDVVFADLPCSGLGVIGRKSDIKYRMQASDMAALAELQAQILGTVSAYVKPGGTLLFSTCTVNKAENEDNVEKFLSEHPDFEASPCFKEALSFAADEHMAKRLIKEGEKGYMQFVPGVHGTDGFFIAKLHRVK